MKTLLDQLRPALLDPQAKSLAAQVQWWDLPGLGLDHPFPVAMLGQGTPLLLLHGFDSSFLEYRRLAPLLADRFQLFIPDLFGFGFSPRPLGLDYGPEPVLRHLDALLERLPTDAPLSLIGASMGGSVAVELARRHPDRVASLLLLAPAGLTGRPMPVPPLLDRFGAWFLGRPGVRRGLCRQAFADPDADVGAPEEQIASLHLQCPAQSLHVIWGDNDRILRAPQKQALQALLDQPVETFPSCGHLPHIDQPRKVAERCQALLNHG